MFNLGGRMNLTIIRSVSVNLGFGLNLGYGGRFLGSSLKGRGDLRENLQL